ncbi:MAG: 4Fe-4S binding protein [Anaerolineae bacterium]
MTCEAKMTITPWMPRIDRARCTGCGDCIALCPTGALGRVDGKAALIAPQACTYCTACEDACPVEAITLPFLICFENNPDVRRDS